MKKYMLMLMLINVLFIITSCGKTEKVTFDKTIKEKSVPVVEVLLGEVVELPDEVGVEPKDEVEEKIEETEVSKEEVIDYQEVNSYECIGAGYFYSETSDEIYPTIDMEDDNYYIEIINGRADKYVIIAVENELDNFLEMPEESDGIIKIEVLDGKVYITEDIANSLYTNIIYYLYEKN